MDVEGSSSEFELISPAFKDNGSIPAQYTCKGQNINPPLSIVGKIKGAKSLALIVHDPDAISGDFLHWLIWDIPPSTDSIAANNVPVGATQGRNDSGERGYMGPCPPSGTGTHHYVFELFALDESLNLPASATRTEVEDAIADHAIGRAQLSGVVSAD